MLWLSLFPFSFKGYWPQVNHLYVVTRNYSGHTVELKSDVVIDVFIALLGDHVSLASALM